MASLLGFFALAYAISWAVWAPMWLPAFGVAMPQPLPVPLLHAFGSFGPALAALVVIGADEGLPGMRRLARRFTDVERYPWLVTWAVLVPLALLAVALALQPLLAGSAANFANLMVNPGFPGISGIMLFLVYLATFGLGEETGWRGYALPELQKRWSPFFATLILAPLWALWHWPVFLYWPGFTGLGWAGILGWIVGLWLGAMILTWLFNASGGSLLVVILFHAAMNTVFANADPAAFAPMAVGVMITVIGIVASVAVWFQVSPGSADTEAERLEQSHP